MTFTNDQLIDLERAHDPGSLIYQLTAALRYARADRVRLLHYVRGEIIAAHPVIAGCPCRSCRARNTLALVGEKVEDGL